MLGKNSGSASVPLATIYVISVSGGAGRRVGLTACRSRKSELENVPTHDADVGAEHGAVAAGGVVGDDDSALRRHLLRVGPRPLIELQ
jgi:hypothetical protein